MDGDPQPSIRAWSWKQGDARLSVEGRDTRVVWTLVEYDRHKDRFHTTSDHQHTEDFTEFGPLHLAPEDVLAQLHRRLGRTAAG